MKFDRSAYEIEDPSELISPSLIYYEDIIRGNIKRAVEIAGGAGRLWPHMKTHKMSEMIRLHLEAGVTRFKCATIAESEMVAACGVKDIVLAYPLVGPNIKRFAALNERYPDARFWAIGDDLEQLALLGRAFVSKGKKARLLIDINAGNNRTGVAFEGVAEFYRACAALEGISVEGLHCYDGHNNNPDRSVRDAFAAQTYDSVSDIKKELEADGLCVEIIILGGTPSFPCYAAYPGVFLSPGTMLVGDCGYASRFEDIGFIPGAAVMSRVISHPAPGLFTIDAGVKGIAADPAGVRGIIAGYEDEAEVVSQSEEHWVFKLRENSALNRPPLGTVLYVLPTHVCPTSALYPAAVAVKERKITGLWEVTARNRKLTI